VVSLEWFGVELFKAMCSLYDGRCTVPAEAARW